jgi:hypothetical protein
MMNYAQTRNIMTNHAFQVRLLHDQEKVHRISVLTFRRVGGGQPPIAGPLESVFHESCHSHTEGIGAVLDGWM